MRVDPGDPSGTILTATPPPPPILAPPPPGGGSPPAPPPVQASEPRNGNGETLTQAEAAVLAEVAAGALGADALARHPLPPGTTTAEALRFLASIPQTTYVLGQPGGTVTGPPIDTLPATEAEFGPDAEDDAEDLWEEDASAQDSPEVHGYEQALDGVSG